MDAFVAHLHCTAGCPGGLSCRFCLPQTKSAAAQRRIRRVVVLSRREARRVIARELLRDLARNPY